MANSYEYSYTDITDPANPVPVAFGLFGVSEDVARAIRGALRKVPTVTNVNVERVTQTREAVTGADPT